MSDNRNANDFGPVDAAREKTGIYRLGFDPASVSGLMFVFTIVTIFGVVGGYLIFKFL